MNPAQPNPIHKILLTTDGSITTILEAITGKQIKVETVEQKIIQADKETAQQLNIEQGDEVNYRVVNLKAGEDIVAHAVSHTPLKRLKEDFREDLMKADLPIGNIINKHQLEVRREINWGRIEPADSLTIFDEDRILSRNYSIIHNGDILINITEYFPYTINKA
ncbi:MAG: chorismate pyruvate-lyase family protein [Archaeoglobaceae archaeon]